MAETLGTAASVIAVIEISAKIAGACLQYHKDVKRARDDIQRFVARINELKETCEAASRLLQGPDGSRLEASKKLLESIRTTHLQLSALYDKLETGQKPAKRFSLRS